MKPVDVSPVQVEGLERIGNGRPFTAWRRILHRGTTGDGERVEI